MFESDQLIYIQMQKTGCTHIASLLSALFDGQQLEKHIPATEAQIAKSRFVVSSIRNPWDWYLSLWTYGVQGNGGLRKRLTERDHTASLKSVVRNPLRSYAAPVHELLKDVKSWSAVYDRSENYQSFRKWLRMIHEANIGRLIGDGFRWLSIDGLCGLMTARYLHLCCQNTISLKTRAKKISYAELMEFESRNCYADFFIRQESLEDDFCRAVEQVRPLSKQERESVYGAKRTNTSKRSLTVGEYYDSATIELVANRDRLLIEKFGYEPPQP